MCRDGAVLPHVVLDEARVADGVTRPQETQHLRPTVGAVAAQLEAAVGDNDQVTVGRLALMGVGVRGQGLGVTG